MAKKITPKKTLLSAKHWILFSLALAVLFGSAGILLSLLRTNGINGFESSQAPVFSVRENANAPAPAKNAPETASETSSVPETTPHTEEIPPATEPVLPEASVVIAQTLDMKVPFGTQAPFGNWDLPYQEACEEASAIMAAAFFQKESLNKDAMDEEILKVIKWEKSSFGYYEDTTAAETAKMLRDYFGLEAEATDEVTIDRIKKQLNLGHLVLLPASGRALNNPHFAGTDAFYHMILIRGYDDQGHFITNDPGTRRGEGFKYTFENILFANHDWTGSKDTIDTGAKTMIVVKGLK